MNNLSNAILKDKEIVIYALQEPHYNSKNGRVSYIPKGVKIFGEKNSRAIIICPQNVPLFYSHEFSSKDCTVCLYESDDTSMYIVSLYLDIHKECVSDDLISMLGKFQQLNSQKNVQTLICCDSNAHSVLFGSDESNNRGIEMEFLIAQYKLHILNNSKKPTFHGARGPGTIVDITLLLGNIQLVNKWENMGKYYFTDHSCLETRMNLQISKKPPLIKHIDWERFKNALPKENRFYKIWTHEVIEQESDLIVDAIKCAISSSTYYKPKKDDSAKFWDEELNQQKHFVRKLFSQWQKNKNAENRKTFISAQNNFRKMIRRKRRTCWKKFVDSIETPQNMSKLVKILQGKANENIGLLKKADGSYCQNSQQTLDLLLSTHFPQSEILSDEIDKELATVKSDVVCSNEDLDLDQFITLDCVKKAINSFGPKKSPGPDGLRPASLQALTEPILKRICRLYKAMLKLNFTPRKWRVCNVIFLAKPNKETYEDVNSFRPLSMSDFLLKTFEKIILWQINTTTLKENPISKNSHAFRSGYSVDTCISDLVDEAESNILRGKFYLFLGLDISGAFNHISNKSAIDALRGKKIPKNIIFWYSHFLYNRSAKADINGAQSAIKINRGQPQGSCLAPLVFSIIFENFIHLFENSPIQCRLFADDITLCIGGFCLDTMTQLMQRLGINKAISWTKKHGLEFAPSKSIAMIFSKKRAIKEPPRLKLGNMEIQYRKNCKYLGIYLDDKLSFTYHWEQKIKSAKCTVYRFKK